jgi:hypothetical protein
MPRLADVAAGHARLQSYSLGSSLQAVEVAPKPKRARRHLPGIKLTAQERRDLIAIYGPILSLEQAAAIAGLAPATLKRQVCEGAYAACAKRGKPLRFIADRFVQELFARPCK